MGVGPKLHGIAWRKHRTSSSLAVHQNGAISPTSVESNWFILFLVYRSADWVILGGIFGPLATHGNIFHKVQNNHGKDYPFQM